MSIVPAPGAAPAPHYTTDIVIVDLEASCPVLGANDIEHSNIIEIGAVRLDRKTLEVTSTFSELVRPRDFPILPFITELTGITPEMVAEREEFGPVARRFVEWYGKRNRAMLAAFGVYYDIPLLRKELRAFGMNFKDHFPGGALDVRSAALLWLAQNGHNTTGVTVKRTLEKMRIADASLSFHRALDDARGEAAILQFFHLGRALL